MSKTKQAAKPVKPASRSIRAGQARPVGKKGTLKSANARQSGRSAINAKPSAAVKGAAVCPECGAVYYDKHWHTAILVPAKIRTSQLPKEKCETCRAGAAYSGELLIEGLTDTEERSEMANLVRNIGKRASQRDPEERIVHIHDDGSAIRVFVSENQLAVSIGKQIDNARKGGKLEIIWSADDKPVRVHWHAPQKKS